MMRYGIPAYRLPRDGARRRDRPHVVALGVAGEASTIKSCTTSSKSAEEGGFDAVFLGVGAQLARRIDIPAGDSSPMSSTR